MDFVAELDPEFARMVADFLRLLHEALIAFLDEIVAGSGPKTPRITGGDFPAVGGAPEHREHFDAQFGDEVEELQDIIFRPLLDLSGRLLRDVGGNERTNGRRLRP